MCRLPFCFFCGKAKEDPRGSDALGIEAVSFCTEVRAQKIQAQSLAAPKSRIKESTPLRQRQKKNLSKSKGFPITPN